jgi:hypothetical protein
MRCLYWVVAGCFCGGLFCGGVVCGWVFLVACSAPPSAEGAKYDSQGQVPSGVRHVAPGKESK